MLILASDVFFLYNKVCLVSCDQHKLANYFTLLITSIYCMLYQGNTSPERENAFTGRRVPIPSKCAPSSCYTQQRLDKKKAAQKVAGIDKEFKCEK